MPNIFGASLLDILSQGGQFIGGRRAAQKEQASALAEALLAKRKADAQIDEQGSVAELNRARAYALGHPAPDLMDLQQTEGAVSAYSKPEYSSAENASNTIAHLGLGKVDPTIVLNATQRRADQVASQQRAEEAAARAEAGAARSTASQDRATASSERANEQAQRRIQEDDARGYAGHYAERAQAEPANAEMFKNMALKQIQKSAPLIGLPAASAIVDEEFTKNARDAKTLGGGSNPFAGATPSDAPVSPAVSLPTDPPAQGGGDWKAVADELRSRGMSNDKILAELKSRGLVR